MKRLLTLMLSATFMVSLAACSSGGKTTDGSESSPKTKEEMLASKRYAAS